MHSSARSSLITLTTDFGLQDPFVGQIKGVILKINPNAAIVDLTHGIPRHNILRATAVISESHRFFPRSTIHLAVVDPGVGSERRALIVEAAGHLFVGPDNGIFTGVLNANPSSTVTSIDQQRFLLKGPGGTFQGRDLFAPVAALLSMGESSADMGSRISDPITVELPVAVLNQEGSLEGEIIHIDVFGNAISNIRMDAIKEVGTPENLKVVVKNEKLDILSHYATAADDAPHALINSDSHLEIFIREGNAAGRLSLVPGTKVTVLAK
jgi:S-adenosylmethionine hydrolase